MKRLAFLLTFVAVMLGQTAVAQLDQDCDTLVWSGRKYAVIVERYVPTVVMNYYQRTKFVPPFQSWSNNNNRGHIAEYEVINNDVYLSWIEAKRYRTRGSNLWAATGIDTVVKPEYFDIMSLDSSQSDVDGAVLADWYSGVLELRLVPKDKKEQKSDEAQGTLYLNVVNGHIVDNVFILDKHLADFKAGKLVLGKGQGAIYYRNERFKEFYLHCAMDREEVVYNGHKGLFQIESNGLPLVMEFFGNDPLKCSTNWLGNARDDSGAPFGSWVLRNDSLFLSEITTRNDSGRHGQGLFDYLADSIVDCLAYCHRSFIDNQFFFADWITGEYVIHYGNWQTNNFGVADYVVYKTQKIRVKEGIVMSSVFSPSSFDDDEKALALNEFKICNEGNVWSVDDKQLAETVGNYKSPKKTPAYKGEKTALRNWFLNKPITDERAKDRLFRVRIAFMVNCNGEAGRWQLISKNKGELFEFANMVLETVKTMPQNWIPATDRKGNAVDCWQILEFTVSNGVLTNANYK